MTEPWDGQANIFWETEAGPDYRVLLRRTRPHTWPHPVNGEQVNVRGPLGTLPPGGNAEWVYKNHGGGDFIVTAFQGNMICLTRRLNIPGAPLVRDPNMPGSPAVAPGAPVATRTVTVEGMDVPVTGNIEHTKQFLLEIMAYKAALREQTPDHELTGLLLRHVLEAKQQNTPTGQLSETLGLVNQVKELFPSHDGGGDAAPWWLPLAGRFLEVLPQLNKGKPNIRMPKPQLPSPTAAIATEPKPHMEESETMPSLVDWQTVLTDAMGHIVSHFTNEPPTPAHRVANLLDLVAPIPVDKRHLLLPLKEQLADYGMSALSDAFADEPQKRASWEPYFYEVFELFTDPNRQAGGFPTE